MVIILWSTNVNPALFRYEIKTNIAILNFSRYAFFRHTSQFRRKDITGSERVPDSQRFLANVPQACQILVKTIGQPGALQKATPTPTIQRLQYNITPSSQHCEIRWSRCRTNLVQLFVLYCTIIFLSAQSLSRCPCLAASRNLHRALALRWPLRLSYSQPTRADLITP